jgi:hypothetical protein
MKTSYKLLFLLSVLFLFSCEKNSETIDNSLSNQLIGYWVNPTENDTILTYEKASDLQSGEYGFEFKNSQIFVERKNAGWCATPPITYYDFEGTWSLNDSTLTINVDYWGGTVDYQWKVISIDETSLKIYKADEEYHNETF